MNKIYRDPSDNQLYHSECLTSEEKQDCEVVTSDDGIDDSETCAFCEDYLAKTPDSELEDLEDDEK